ncbi:MAG TPA: molybdenum ABC transporter permease, partial [Paraburkholderia sp.]|nr:molybdenum ABC transporter permease [Paraburkholderia sp.]
PATMRVAELMGLHNVGDGTVVAPGRIAAGHGTGLVLDTADRSIAVGQHVMWRVSSRAIVWLADGPYAATLDAIELRRGEQFACMNLDGVRLECVSAEGRLQEGQTCRFAIDPDGVSVWAI